MTANSAHNLNVEAAWIQGVTGCNRIVAIVDDGTCMSERCT